MKNYQNVLDSYQQHIASSVESLNSSEKNTALSCLKDMAVALILLSKKPSDQAGLCAEDLWLDAARKLRLLGVWSAHIMPSKIIASNPHQLSLFISSVKQDLGLDISSVTRLNSFAETALAYPMPLVLALLSHEISHIKNNRAKFIQSILNSEFDFLLTKDLIPLDYDPYLLPKNSFNNEGIFALPFCVYDAFGAIHFNSTTNQSIDLSVHHACENHQLIKGLYNNAIPAPSTKKLLYALIKVQAMEKKGQNEYLAAIIQATKSSMEEILLSKTIPAANGSTAHKIVKI